MDLAWTEERSKIRRDKSKEAIALALQGSWEKAVNINRGILQLFPDDADALNRLGKALLELGRYSEARTAFEDASRISPYNTISKKNLERLNHLQESSAPPQHRKVVTPVLFIEESGKSGTTMLRKPAPREVLAKMAARDTVKLEPRDHLLVVTNEQGEYLGEVEAKLGMRLIRLMKGGNRYDAGIVSVNRQEVSVIIWETYRHPSQDAALPFPSRTGGEYRAYWRGAPLRYDIEGERDEDEEFSPDWRGGRPDVADGGREEEPAEAAYSGKPEPETGEDEEV